MRSPPRGRGALLGNRTNPQEARRLGQAAVRPKAEGFALAWRRAVLMGTLSEYLGLRLALALGAVVSAAFWLATRFRHNSMAAGLERSPMVATEAAHAGLPRNDD